MGCFEQLNQVVIKGPFGFGLNLPKVLKGNFVLVAGGTGILPFLDLLFFVLLKVTEKRYDQFKP